MAHHHDAYAPEALELMTQEFARRGEAVPDIEPNVAPPPPGKPSSIPYAGVPRNTDGSYVQYVGAWGLHILLTCVAGIPLAIAMNHARPHGQGEAVTMTLIWIILGLLASFVAFWISVKLMIVDRFLEQLRTDKK
jgi:hypothetical protein